MSAWLIYGANGYTGDLIAREAVRRGLAPIVAGRNAFAIESLGKELGVPARAFALENPAGVEAALRGVQLVLNCAGPFTRTAEPMLQGCLSRGAHYLDITGEIDVLEYVHGIDQQARAAGIVVCPGAGFDVVPTDCVALMLKESMPDATHLTLAFDGTLEPSPGTAKSMLVHAGAGTKIRKAGKIIRVRENYGARTIDFGEGERRVVAVPMGDVSTAYYTTGIADIVVYAHLEPRAALGLRIAGLAGGLIDLAPVRDFLTRRIDRTVTGPSEDARRTRRTRIWGEARDAAGRAQHVRVQTSEPYAFTVTSALGIVQRLLDEPASPGTITPARLMGSSFVLDLPGTTIEDSKQTLLA